MAWEQLLVYAREAAAWVRHERTSPPEACPNDGTPLRPGPDGVLYCEFDGWQYPRDRM